MADVERMVAMMSRKEKALWYLTETSLVPAVVSAITTTLFWMFF